MQRSLVLFTILIGVILKSGATDRSPPTMFIASPETQWSAA
jgi:hypothetical protein